MAQSLNTKVDLVMDATSFHGMNNYGKIMIGDRGFEYYNEKKMNDYIQIPWEEVDYVIASVMFKGKYIPRFAIQTKKSGTFTFATPALFTMSEIEVLLKPLSIKSEKAESRRDSRFICLLLSIFPTESLLS